jgi:hypothetical protein
MVCQEWKDLNCPWSKIQPKSETDIDNSSTIEMARMQESSTDPSHDSNLGARRPRHLGARPEGRRGGLEEKHAKDDTVLLSHRKSTSRAASRDADVDEAAFGKSSA